MTENAWVSHIREFAKRNKMTYACALTDPRCIAEYRAKKNAALRKKK